MSARYCGRFAPSPTGPLHFGSLVGALASWLDARAHGGTWLVRIEDVDGPRTVPGAADALLDTLAAFGLAADAPPVWQSRRDAAYTEALDALTQAGHVYPCGCTRREIADSLRAAHERHTTLAYPGTCRGGLHGKPARAWRLRVPDGAAASIRFDDRWQGEQTQDLATEVGDFVLKRADGQWAYQLAVVVDDRDAGVTHVARGAYLLDSAARQIYLQQCLGATALDPSRPLAALNAAATHLGLTLPPAAQTSFDAFFPAATVAWAVRFGPNAR